MIARNRYARGEFALRRENSRRVASGWKAPAHDIVRINPNAKKSTEGFRHPWRSAFTFQSLGEINHVWSQPLQVVIRMQHPIDIVIETSGLGVSTTMALRDSTGRNSTRNDSQARKG